MSDPSVIGPFLLGGLLCAIGAYLGFDRPTWSRTFTTGARFRGALLMHVFLYVSIFFIVFALLRVTVESASHEAVDIARERELVVILICLAFGITLILRMVWAGPRRWLHRIAGIPSHGLRLAAVLAESELNPSHDILQRTRDTLVSRGVDIDADWLPAAQPTHRLLLKAAALFIQIRDWENERRFRRFVREVQNDIANLRRRFDRLSFRVARSLTSIERLGEVRHRYSAHGDPSVEADNLLRKIIADQFSDSCEDIRVFYEDACLLTARATLATQRSREKRRAFIASLGFELKKPVEQMGYGFLVTTGVLLYFGMWLFYLVLPTQDRDIEARTLITVVSIIVFGAMVIAIVPKRLWGFANAGLHPKTPIGFVVAAGFCAALFAIVVNLVAGAVVLGGVEGALMRLHAGAPWLLAIFLTAATVAWLVQDHRWLRVDSSRQRRLLDGVTLGVVWVIAAIVGSFIKASMFAEPIDPGLLVKTAVGSFAFGVIVGFFTAESARSHDMRLLRSASAMKPGTNFELFKPRPAGA